LLIATLLAAALTSPGGAADQQPSAKQDVKDAGKAVGQVAREIGHGTRDVAKTVGHTTRKVTRTVGHAVRDGAKAATDAAKGTDETKPPKK
jgi:hypothetical protein